MLSSKVIKNILQTKTYFNLSIFVIIMMLLITVMLQMYILPTFKKIAFENILNEAKKVSHYMSDIIDYQNETTENIDKKLEVLINDFKIDKIHFFDKNGKVIYSTVEEKIDSENTHEYFNEIVAKGEIYHSIKIKGEKSSELEPIKKSVIEIYIPIMKENNFTGAFELYYDISKNVKEFDEYASLILRINLLLVLGTFILFFILMYLISLKSLKEKDLISKDYLTNLYNRRYFYEIIENILDISKRANSPVSICMIDIDDFKQINDKYGHDIGDDILKTFAKEIKTLTRKSDILVRFGGEEFLLLLHNTDIKNAQTLATKICKHFENLNNEIAFTVSIGISEHTNNENIDETIKEADKHLYKAKEEGKNRVIC